MQLGHFGILEPSGRKAINVAESNLNVVILFKARKGVTKGGVFCYCYYVGVVGSQLE